MENKNKLVEYFKKITDGDAAIKRIPVYFFLICVLLVILLFRLGKTNEYLQIIAENGTAIFEYETRDDTFIDISTETTKSFEEQVPIAEIITDESTKGFQDTTKDTTTEKVSATKSERTTSSTENTTATTAKQLQDNGVSRKTYVINTNTKSKKIHSPDCSSAIRIKEENKKTVKLSDEELQSYINNGYDICKICGGV